MVQTSHPSKSLNAAILQQVSIRSPPWYAIVNPRVRQYMDAKMAITDDSDWSTALTEVRITPVTLCGSSYSLLHWQNDIVMPKPRHLTERVLANNTLVRDARGSQRP